MKAGDIVRFTRTTNRSVPEWELGLLIEYHSWEKIARILHDGKILSLRAEFVQLAHRAPENI